MAFHPWSVPFFVGVGVAGVAAVLWVAWAIPARARFALTALSSLPVLLLCAIARWANQGVENTYGHQLYLAALGVLVVVIVALLGIAVSAVRWFSRQSSRADSRSDL